MNNNSKKLLKILIVLIILYIGELMFFDWKNTIIKVDGRKIYESQFQEAFVNNQTTQNLMSMGFDINKNKKSPLYLFIKGDVVEDLIKQSLIKEEIGKRKIKISNDEINKEFQYYVKSIGSEEFNMTLKAEGISASQFKKNFTEELKRQKLAESISKIEVSDNDYKQYYNENIKQYQYPKQVRFSHILILANPEQITKKIKTNPDNKNLTDSDIKKLVNTEISEKLKKANELLTKVKQNPNAFAEIAKKNSEDKTSSQNGGDMGIVTEQQLPPDVAKILFSLEINKPSDIVKLHNGYHIMIITDKIKAKQDSLEKVKAEINFKVRQQKSDNILDKWATAQEKHAKIEYKNENYRPQTVKDILQKKPAVPKH